MTTPHPLTFTVSKGPGPTPQSCTRCTKRGHTLERVVRQDIECGHVECPKRRRPTAQASDRPPEVDE